VQKEEVEVENGSPVFYWCGMHLSCVVSFNANLSFDGVEMLFGYGIQKILFGRLHGCIEQSALDAREKLVR